MSQERKQGEMLDELRQRADLSTRFQKIPFGYNPAQVADYMLEQRRSAERQQREIRREQEQLLIEIDQLHSEIAAKNVAIESLKKRVSGMENRTAENDTRSAETEQRMQEYQRGLESLKRRLAEAEHEMKRRDEAMDAADRMLNEYEKELETLRAALHCAEADKQRYAEEHAYCEKVRGIMAELGDAAVRIRSVMEQNAELEAAVQERDARVASLEEELDALKQQLEQLRPAEEKRPVLRQASVRAVEKWEHSEQPQDSFMAAYNQLTGLIDQAGEKNRRATPYRFRTRA